MEISVILFRAAKFDAYYRLSSVTRRSMLFYERDSCVHEPYVRVRSYTRVYLLLWIPWEEKHNNEEWLPGIHAHVPSPFLACVPVVLGWSPKEIRSARDPSFLLSSFFPSSKPSHPLSSPRISRTYTAFVTRLRDNPLALRNNFGGGPAGYITDLWIKNNVPTSREFI